jgi:polar amino acid transport system ATP-binding protein
MEKERSSVVIEVKNLYKFYGDQIILNNINFLVRKGKLVSIIGPSGCGKSTLLRCINGLEIPNKGSIYIKGIKLSRKNVRKTKYFNFLRRKIGIVFQEFNLFPHKTIFENVIIAPILVLKKNYEESKKMTIKLLNELNLIKIKNLYPHQLSGGQKQRTAIARTLSMSPEIILYDEPTSSLDTKLKNKIGKIIVHLNQNKKTQIIVTHEIQFAEQISDCIIYMKKGKVIEIKVNKLKNIFKI